MNTSIKITFITFICIVIGLTAGLPVLATRLPDDLSATALKLFPNATIRLDGAISTSDGQLYLLLVSSNQQKKGKITLDEAFPGAKQPDLVLYTNGWAHIKVTRKGEACYISLPSTLPGKRKKQVLSLRFPSDLIVPDNFVIPKSLQVIGHDVTITSVEDAVIAKSDFGNKPESVSPAEYKGRGTVFLTSVSAGSITMLDGKTLTRIAEFPTEGTPCSMCFVGKKLYIADQTKNRILILDPYGRHFIGQIDLGTRSAPKDVVSLLNGQWLCVSESALSSIAFIETATGKVLQRLKVNPGPGQIAVTPDGVYLIALNVTSGEATVVATYNQKVISTIRVGDMPVAIVITNNGKTAYVCNRMTNTVSVIDVTRRTVIGTIKTGNGPSGLALSPDGKRLYVAVGRENLIVIYDTGSLVKLQEVSLGSDCQYPGRLCLLPGGKQLVVLSQLSPDIVVVDVDTLEYKKIPSIGHPAHDAVWEPVP